MLYLLNVSMLALSSCNFSERVRSQRLKTMQKPLNYFFWHFDADFVYVFKKNEFKNIQIQFEIRNLST